MSNLVPYSVSSDSECEDDPARHVLQIKEEPVDIVMMDENIICPISDSIDCLETPNTFSSSHCISDSVNNSLIPLKEINNKDNENSSTVCSENMVVSDSDANNISKNINSLSTNLSSPYMSDSINHGFIPLKEIIITDDTHSSTMSSTETMAIYDLDANTSNKDINICNSSTIVQCETMIKMENIEDVNLPKRNSTMMNNSNETQCGNDIHVLDDYRHHPDSDNSTKDSESSSDSDESNDSESNSSSSYLTSSSDSDEVEDLESSKSGEIVTNMKNAPKVNSTIGEGSAKNSKIKSTRNKKEAFSEDAVDLPPIEDLRISIKQEEAKAIGTVYQIVDTKVVVQSYQNIPAINLDSVLFLDEGKRALGQIFDVFGPIQEPLYVVRFNSTQHVKEKAVEIGTVVYFGPQSDYTSYVLINELMRVRGSDASWKDDQEPPVSVIDYSDDEEERKAKAARKKKTGDKVSESKSVNPFTKVPTDANATSNFKHRRGDNYRSNYNLANNYGNANQNWRFPRFTSTSNSNSFQPNFRFGSPANFGVPPPPLPPSAFYPNHSDFLSFHPRIDSAPSTIPFFRTPPPMSPGLASPNFSVPPPPISPGILGPPCSSMSVSNEGSAGSTFSPGISFSSPPIFPRVPSFSASNPTIPFPSTSSQCNSILPSSSSAQYFPQSSSSALANVHVPPPPFPPTSRPSFNPLHPIPSTSFSSPPPSNPFSIPPPK